MRNVLRALFAPILSLSLSAGPAYAAAKPLGVVLSAERANVGSISASSGITVLAGDRLTTDAAGTLRLRAGSAHIYLLPGSAASMEDLEDGVAASVTRGTIGFSTPSSQNLSLRIAGIYVRPRAAGATHGQVQLVDADNVIVTSYKGIVDVVTAAGVFPVPEGSTYRISLQPGAGPEGVGKDAARRAHVVESVAGSVIAAAIIAVVIWQNTISPNRP